MVCAAIAAKIQKRANGGRQLPTIRKHSHPPILYIGLYEAARIRYFARGEVISLPISLMRRSRIP
jgi:hypothetical protein